MTAVTPQAAADERPGALDSRFVRVAELPWEQTRHPGVETKALLSDPSSGMLTALIRMAPGARLPDHEHVLIEQTLVLAGALHCGEGACQTGDFVWRPAGSRHEAWAGPDGCTALAMFLVPNRFFESGGRIVDFLGNDWERTWGAKVASRAKGPAA